MNDLEALLLGSDNPWSFLVECALRTGLMFFCVLLLMKLTGKKEVRQFSVLELLVIIGLGSALGDPMIYADVPLLPSLVAIAVVLLLYWGVNKLTNRAPRLEALVEGEVTRVLTNGVVDLRALDNEGMSSAEFFGDLRVLHVEHLGQVKAAYVEIDGEISVFFHADKDIRYGLPLAPEILADAERITRLHSGPYCCGRCGYMQDPIRASATCMNCEHDRWVRAASFKRVA